MAAPTNVLTPQVAGIHWDDILSEFQLHISYTIKTPVGNFRKEVRVSASDLLAAIQEIMTIWGSTTYAGVDHSTAPFGNKDAFTAYVTALPVADFTTVAAPTASVDDSALEDPSYAWPGSTDYPLPT